MEEIVGFTTLIAGVVITVAVFLALVLLALINHKAERTNDLLEYLIQIHPQPPVVGPAGPPRSEPAASPALKLLV
jgi:hypothetical protein